MGRFKHLVNFLANMEGFRAKYYIPPKVGLQYCPLDWVLTDREVGEVVIPMIAFIKGGMTLSMGRITRDYLLNHKLCPHQCTTNMFKVLRCVDTLNDQMNLRLTWHDITNIYECHSLARGYYLKSRSEEVRLISCLPKSNKGLKDDYLVISREWHDGLHCPVRAGTLGGVP